MDWLHAHEFLAIWLEGVALVLIFVWDRLDSRSQHRETLAQLKATEKQIEVSEKNAAAAKATAESVINAERARIIADLEWRGSGHDYAFRVTNWGRTPAIVTSYGFRTDGVPIEVRELPKNLGFVNIQNTNIMVKSGGDFKILDRFEMSHYMSEWWQDIHAGKKTGIFEVSVKYLDVFSGTEERETRMVYSYKVSESRFVPLTRYTRYT